MSFNLYHNLPELARKGGFSLCDGSDEKDNSIDWRFIASVDTTRIVKESDFEKLDECIPFIIRSSVGNLLNVRILDPAIARIYIVSQFCLQYLLFCTQFLDKSVNSLRENVYNYQKRTIKLEEDLEKRDEEIAQLQKKLKRHEALSQQIFPCTKCTKNFLSAALLENHVARKHPQQQESKDKDLNLINTIKFELEIQQLKDKLNLTEKELMDRKSVFIECQKCFKLSQKRFQSIAIQSNFEEKEKDDIEKDGIHQLFNSQMRYFEDWKQNQENQYRHEINELRNKLDETIILRNAGSQQNTSCVEQNEGSDSQAESVQIQSVNIESLEESLAILNDDAPAPSPAPRTLKLSEKAVGTSKSIEPLIIDKKAEEVEWKTRYHELVKMYEDNQQRMALTVTNIEKTYNEKISEIEKSLKSLKGERLLKETAIRREPPEALRIIKKSSLPNIPKRSASAQPRPTSPITKKKPEMLKTKIPIKTQTPLSPKIVKRNVVVDLISSSSSESENPPVIKPRIVQVAEPTITTKPTIQNFSSQKFSVHAKKLKPEKEEPATKTSPRDAAEVLFNRRLGLLGIPGNKVKMSKLEFDRVDSELANLRDASKKKNKSFFILRKKLQSKVDEIFQQKYKQSDYNINENTNVKNIPNVKEKSSFSACFTKSQKELPNVIEVKPEKPEEGVDSKVLFRENLEKILEKRLPVPQQSQIEELLPSKKKVLFDMKHLDEPKNLGLCEINEEDESDFDISSFASEEIK